MSVELTVRQVGDVTIVDARGRITLGEEGSGAFREKIIALIAEGHKKIRFNGKFVRLLP